MSTQPPQRKSSPAVVLTPEAAAEHQAERDVLDPEIKPPGEGEGTFYAHVLYQANRTNIKMLKVLEEQRDLLRDFRDEFILYRKSRENGH